MDLIALPKTELHLHLEGAILQQTLLRLVQKYGGSDEVPNLKALQDKFRYRDFAHFIGTWQWMVTFIREYEDFRLIASRVAQDLTAQGVRYAELHFSPGDFERHGLRLQPLALAIRAGLHEASQKSGSPLESRFGLILDLGRDNGPEKGMRWLEEAAEVAAEAGILGIGLGGSEQLFPPDPYQPVFQRAAAIGLHRVAHAGEAAGPESMWAAIESLVALDSATHTDLTNGRRWTTPRDLDVDNTLDWLDHRFAQAERLKAHGFDDRLSTLDGVPSSVYTSESVVPDGILLVERELVNGNPLIGQEHQWLVDPDDRSSKTLIRTVRHLDYRVVPKE